MEGAFPVVPSIASIPRFTQNPRALPSAFAVLCAQPQGAIFAVNEGFGACGGIFTFFAIGVQWLNCIPLSDFFSTHFDIL